MTQKENLTNVKAKVRSTRNTPRGEKIVDQADQAVQAGQMDLGLLALELRTYNFNILPLTLIFIRSFLCLI